MYNENIIYLENSIIRVTTNKYGYINLSTVYNNQYYHYSYLYWELEEAIEHFKDYILSEDSKVFENMEG